MEEKKRIFSKAFLLYVLANFIFFNMYCTFKTYKLTIIVNWHEHISLFSALCKDDANGNVPLGKSCNRYWACQGGYPRLQRCPAMLVFDKNRRRCVTPPTEDCEVPTTVEPPTDESQNDNGSGPRSPNPRRGGGGGQQSRRNNRPPPAQPIPLDGPSDQLPFNLPPGAVPLN